MSLFCKFNKKIDKEAEVGGISSLLFLFLGLCVGAKGLRTFLELAEFGIADLCHNLKT